MDTSSNKHFIIAFVCVFITAGIFWWVGYRMEQSKESGSLPINVFKISNITGEIQDINGQTILLKTYSQDIAVRTVVTDNNTIFEKIIMKDPALYQREVLAFSEEIRSKEVTSENLVAKITPPVPYTKEKIFLSDIKKGDRVTVSSVGDIATAKQFTATIILVQQVSGGSSR